MINKALVGRCGLYCGACVIYRAERDDPDWRQRIAQRAGTTADKVRCNGCSGLSRDCWGTGCKILICIQSKGHSYCYQCEEYKEGTCAMYTDLEARYTEAGENVRENMRAIAEGRTEQWLEAMQQQFTCAVCHKPMAAGVSCHHCRDADQEQG